MTAGEIVAFALNLLLPLAVLFGFLLWAASRRKPKLPPPMAAPGAAQEFYCKLFFPEDLSPSAGLFRIADGLLLFVPEAASEPQWAVAASDVSATPQGMLAMSRGNVLMQLPGRSAFPARVSREHINSFMENDFKRMREATYAKEFAAALRAAAEQG